MEFDYYNIENNLEKHSKNLIEKLNKLDEIACITDIKSLNLFNPQGGFSIKQEESEKEEYWAAAMEESKTHSYSGILLGNIIFYRS